VETPAVRAFRAASAFFVEVVAAVPPERYEEPWSDEWRVLDLIGHGNRANLLPVEYYERPVEAASADDLAEYLLPENIAQRGREATAALGDDPVAAVRSASERVLAVIASAPDDAVVGTPFGERSLDSYLTSRTAELVLHGLDLDTPVDPPAEALAECGAFLVAQAVGAGRGVDVVRALSGRGTLPPEFNVY
jgi:mycothiol maleylpyruvate isomerase-like protein